MKQKEILGRIMNDPKEKYKTVLEESEKGWPCANIQVGEY